MEEVINDPIDSTTSKEEDSTEGDEQGAENNDADASQIDAPAENNAAPAEEPTDNVDEAEESGSTDLGMDIMVAGDPTEQTITYKVMKGETEASTAAAVEFDPASVTKDGAKVTVKAETAIKFTVTLAEEIVAADPLVTAKDGGTAIETTNITSSETDGVYTITIANGAEEAALKGNVEITIHVADKTYEVNAPATESNVSWKIKKSTADEYDTTNASKVTVTKADSVTVQATLEKGKDSVAVTLNGETKTLAKVETTAEEAASTAEFTVKVADLELAATVTLTADYVVKKEVTYTVVADENATVSIEDAKGTAVTPADATAGTYKLTSNETYLIKIAEITKTEDLAKLQSITVGSTPAKYNSVKKGFEFTAKEADETITVTLVPETTAFSVTLVMDDDAVGAATVKADKYKIGAEDNAEQAADTAPQAIGTPKTYAGVWKGTDFSFALAIADADAEYYEITKVATSTDGETWTALTGTDGQYTIEAISANTQVKVFTDLKADKVYSIKFTASDDVKTVMADLAGATNYTKVDLNKEYRIKAVDNAAVKFQITTETGYTVDKVSYGTGTTDTLDADSEVYTYDKFAADNKTATINISTKAAALAGDKFVTFIVGDGVTLKVNGDVKSEKNAIGEDVYKLTKAVAEVTDAEGKVTTPAVAEISELKFDLTVPYGSYLPFQDFADGTTVRATTEKRVKSEDGKTWTYSYKVVANQVETGTSLDAPYVIELQGSALEYVTLKLADVSESVEYKVLDEGYGYNALPDEVPVNSNKTVILQATPGQSLKVNGEAVELDDSYRYRFDTKLDEKVEEENGTVYEIEAKSAAAYKLRYTIGEDYTKTAGEEPVEVEYGSTVALQLVKADGTTPVAISKKEVTENAKSEVKLANQTTNKGDAEIKVKDANVTLTLYTIETKQVGTIDVETEVEAAKITLTSKDASGKVLTVKGITKGKSVKLDATSVTSYALTLKEGNKTLNAADYDSALTVSCDATKVIAVIEGGNLVVKPLAAAETEVKILAAADGSELFNFKVNGQAPALKVKSVTSVNQGMHDILVDVAADASIKTISDQFDLYYEVEVKKTDGASTLNKDGIYYLLAVPDAKGKIAPVSQLFKVNTELDNEKMENTYSFTVRLVAVSAAGTTVNQGTPVSGGSGTKLLDTDVKFATAAANSKTVSFKTRKGYYEDKLSVTKKTTKLYSGQEDILVAIPKFSKNASHIEEIKAVVYNKDGSLVTSSYGDSYMVSARIDSETLGVYVSAGAYTAGSYDVVIYATATKDGSAYDMYRASAKVPITVQKGINWISVDCPKQIAVLGKDASVTLKTTGYYDFGSMKAQTQKFRYELDTENISNPKNKDQVIVKNNKITVKKGFKVGADPDDNTFTVNVYANDYSTNEESTSVEITVTNEALVIGSVKLVDYDTDKELGDTVTTEEIEFARVVLTDDKGRTIDPDLVTLTPNKGKIFVESYGDGAYIQVSGYQKNLTIKAVTKDGGKKSASSKKYTITYPEGISYDIKRQNYSSNFSELETLSSGAVLNKTGNTYTYLGRGNDTIGFYVTATSGSGVEAYERQAYTSHFNYSVKVTGGKNTSSKSDQADGYYAITPTAKDVKITITDKTKKAPNNTTEFTFTDNGWTTTAAPTASTKGKLYAAKNAANNSYIYQNLTYTVKWKNNVSYPYVKLTQISGISINGAAGIKPIAGDSTFTLQNVYGSVGTAKYSVVYGDRDADGIFIPKTKAATLSIKVNKAANPKAVNKYTINPKVSMSAQLQVKPALAGYENRVKFKGVLSANNKGNKNQFYDYFEVVGDKLQIKAEKWTQTELDRLDPKNDLTGYLVYEYYDVTTGRKVEKQDKITVVISDKTAPKYTATNVDIVAVDRATAATTIKLGGTAVPIAKVAVDSDAWEAALPTPAADETTGVVNLTAKATPANGNVDLYVIPADSQNGSGAALTSADPKTAGIKVTVKVTVKAADDNKTKITIAKGAKTPVASINKGTTPAKVDLTVELKAGRDFTYNLSNATIKPTGGVAKTDASKITDAAKKKAAEAVNSVSYADGTITIVLDRDKLDGNKQYNIPVDLDFTAGAKETVYFPVKTEKIPSKEDVKKLVESELKDFAVAKASYNNAAAAAAAVKAAADAIQIPALSGIEVTAAAAKDAEKFADNGDKKGDHTIKITLTDRTKAADNTIDAEITVTEKATTPTVGDALKEAIEKYAIPGPDGKVPEGKIAVTEALKDGDTLQTALQKAVDNVEPYKYNVKVSNIVVTAVDVPAQTQNEVLADEAAAKKVTNLTFSYKVLKATTGQPMETQQSYAVDLAAGTIETPATTPDEPVTPNPGTETKEVATIEITASATSVTKGGTVTFTAELKASDGSVITDAEKVATIEWSVTGNTDTSGTKIEADSGNKASATLTVSAEEVGPTLTVKAKVGSVDGTVTVTVEEASGNL